MLELDIQAIHFTAGQPLLDVIHKKVHKLTTFYKQILKVQVFLRLEGEDSKHNKVVEIKFHAPGSDFFATAHAESFEKATAKTVEALRRQIRRAKGKQQATPELPPETP